MPRIRTINEAYKQLKESDPQYDILLEYLRGAE